MAQYERNCHTCPMIKELVDVLGSVVRIGVFVLNASKHKAYLS